MQVEARAVLPITLAGDARMSYLSQLALEVVGTLDGQVTAERIQWPPIPSFHRYCPLS